MDENKKAPQVRYSDEDLEEFKALILESDSLVHLGSDTQVSLYKSAIS